MDLSGTFVISYLFWVVLSGCFDYFQLSLGIIASAIAAHAFHELLPDGKRLKRRKHKSYHLFNIYQILVAGMYMTYLVLHPRMSTLIDPISSVSEND